MLQETMMRGKVINFLRDQAKNEDKKEEAEANIKLLESMKTIHQEEIKKLQ